MTGGVVPSPSIFASTSLELGDQVFAAVDTPEPLILDTVLESSNVDIDLANGEFIVKVSGIYNFTAFPNLFKTSGGQAEYDIWLSIDEGSGWADVPRSSSRTTLLANTNNTDLVYVFPYKGLRLQVGWKIRFMSRVNDTAIRLATIVEPGIPEIPANFISLVWQGHA